MCHQINLVHRGHKLFPQYAVERLWMEPKFQLTSIAIAALLHIQEVSWTHCGYITWLTSWLPPAWSLNNLLLFHKSFFPHFSATNSTCRPHVPSSLSTYLHSYAWEDGLLWAILPNRSYMSTTSRNWFFTPTASDSLRNLLLPYGSHLFFMPPSPHWRISGKGEGNLQDLRYDSVGACKYKECAYAHAGEVRVGWLSAGITGEVINLAVYVTPPVSCRIVVIQRSPPALLRDP